jgi:hypothetical protein
MVNLNAGRLESDLPGCNPFDEGFVIIIGYDPAHLRARRMSRLTVTTSA